MQRINELREVDKYKLQMVEILNEAGPPLLQSKQMILESKEGWAKKRKKSHRVLLHRFIRIAPVHRFGNCTGQFKR